MDVHIHRIGWQIEPQECDGLTAREQEPPVCLLHRVKDGAIAEGPASHEEMLESAAGHVVFGATYVARDCDLAVIRLHLQEPVGQFVAEEAGDPLSPCGRRGQVVHAPGAGRC